MPLPGRRNLLASGLGGAMAVAALPPGRRPPLAPAQVQPILVMSGEISGTYARIASDLSVAVGEPGLRVMACLSHGSLDNLQGLIGVHGVDLGLVAADTLAHARDVLRLPNLDRIQSVAKLYDNEVHVLALDPAIRTLADLRGRRVCTDVEGSGTAVTCDIVFQRLGLPVTVIHDNPDRAVERLRAGDLDALAYVIGKPGSLFRSARVKGLHLVEVPYTDALQADYLPAEFTAADYPGLVPDGQTVASIAVGVVLACFAWDPGNDRYRGLIRFIELFIRAFPDLRDHSPPFHPKWRDVNLDARVPGWTRYGPVAGLLQASRRASATPAAPGSDVERLLHSMGVDRPTAHDIDVMRDLLSRNARR